MSSTPPRIAERLLAMRLRRRWRDFVLGDLQEEFDARFAVSPPDARRWYWHQAIRCLLFPPRGRRVVTVFDSTSSGDPMVRTLVSDTRYALRVLRRAPAFAGAVVVVLALGIGANAAIFSIVNTVLLRPLPFARPDGLVRLFHVPPQSTFPGIRRFSVSPANFYDWKKDAKSFDRMAIYRSRQFALSTAGTAETVVAGAVGADFFETVAATPSLGRTFLPEEDSPARGHVVILSDAVWKSRFAGAPDVVGRALMLDGASYSIVGVMPKWFSIKSWGVTGTDIWVPIALTDAQRSVRDNHNEQVVARLRPGVTIAQAQAEMDAISSRLERAYPKENTGWGAAVVSLRGLIVGDVRLFLVMLLAAVGLVLLIACANVGNLLFTRALSRRKELAIRSALGAGRGRVFQQLLIETLLLSLLGGATGLVLARSALGAGATLLANQVPRADELALDWHVVFFVGSVSVLTGILTGALPALRAGRSDLNEALKEGGRSDSAVGMRTRQMLIVCEVALSVVLLMAAGVMLRSLLALHSVETGFDASNVLTLRITPRSRYATPEQFNGLLTAALERLRALPGVQAAAAIDDLPMQGGSVQPLVLDGHAELLPKDQPTVQVRKITPDYLTAMRIPLVRGQDVSWSDAGGMLVSRAAAKLLWGNQDPIGQRVRLPLESKTAVRHVIGIVGDVKQGDLTEPAQPTVYEYAPDLAGGEFAITLRSGVPPLSLAQAAVAAIHGIDAGQPVDAVQTMQHVVDETLASQRFSAWLLGLFAALALVLASVGIYSVLSYIVRGRSREIGIRSALGARTPDVLRLVILEGMAPALVGIAIGAIGALAAAGLLRKLVFGVSATDPLTLGLVSFALAAVALVASIVPAWRASNLDPLIVLRGN